MTVIDTTFSRSWPAGCCSTGRLQRSLSFYRLLGLAIAANRGAGTVFYAGGPSSNWPASVPLPDPAARFQGSVAAGHVACHPDRLEGRGVPVARGPPRIVGVARDAKLTDPDGVTLIFVQVPETHPLRRDSRG